MFGMWIVLKELAYLLFPPFVSCHVVLTTTKTHHLLKIGYRGEGGIVLLFLFRYYHYH